MVRFLEAGVLGLFLILGISGSLASCTMPDHQHGGTSSTSGDHHAMEDDLDAGHEDHFVRDPATQPCDAMNWRGYVPDLRECVLTGVVLAGENLRRVDLTDADLSGADLTGADLFKGVLVRTKLVGTTLANAHMVSIDLTQANLTNAHLEGADLTNAILTNATLDGATTNEMTVCPNLMFGPCW